MCYSRINKVFHLPSIHMPKIKILPDKRSRNVVCGTTLLQATLTAGIELPQSCGGNASCTTCRVFIREGEPALSPPSLAEREVLAEVGLLCTHRLACQARLFGDVVIERPVWG